jgi:AcrR family transcriptional regulator
VRSLSRKNEILQTLIDIFKEQGINDDFTMSEIASKLDIGKSTIYEYFKTKDDLLTSAIVYLVEYATNTILKRAEQDDLPFEQSMKNELYYMFALAKESRLLISGLTPRIKGTMSNEYKAVITNKVREVNDFYQQKFNEIFLKGVNEGLFQTSNDIYDEAIIGSIIAGSVLRLSNQYINTIEDVDIEVYIDRVYDVIMHIITKK